VNGYRREAYRVAAADLSRRYGTVILEDFNLALHKRLNAPEAEADAPPAQRAQLHASAPGEFRLALTSAVSREGGIVAKIGAAGTTSQCHSCGCDCDWNQGEELSHTCEHCGTRWDQDENGARNLLRCFAAEARQETPRTNRRRT
jgi:hypothetical protein